MSLRDIQSGVFEHRAVQRLPIASQNLEARGSARAGTGSSSDFTLGGGNDLNVRRRRPPGIKCHREGQDESERS